jgi:5'-methylthioadenosine phosphorylase
VAIALILGTGFEGLFQTRGSERVTTPHGRFDYQNATVGGVKVVLIPRHGLRHEIPPRRLPTKAHMLAIRSLGIRRVLAVSAVGSVDARIGRGEVVLPDQFIDLTKHRDATFYADVAVHTDFSEPFCGPLRRRVLRAAEGPNHLVIHDRGVYVGYEGPRYSTAAEISMIRGMGGDLVGQSAVQEAVLARELGLCYALIAVVSNLATGLQQRVDSRDILQSVWGQASELSDFFRAAIPGASKSSRRGFCTANSFEAQRLYRGLSSGEPGGAPQAPSG